MLKFNEDRTFGVEIEILTSYNFSMATIANLIRERGVECYTEGYNHQMRNHWKVITDASCGWEIVSPVLKGYEGLNQIKIVCEALNSLGAKVNKKCGLHVHHDGSDFTGKHLKNLFTLYAKYERSLDSIMPPSRRGNNAFYCQSIIKTDYENHIKELGEMKVVPDFYSKMYCGRYYKLNVQSFLRHGTLEFRHHSGTTDAEKIINWVMLTQAMVTKATTGSVVKVIEKEYNEITHLLWVLGMCRKEQCTEEYFKIGKFYTKRMREFRKSENQEEVA